MFIEKKHIKYNFSSRNGQGIEYIVIHDTGNTSAGANADAHYRYFDSANRRASAHYFVDDKKIIQTVDDADAAWHCGDGKGKFGITNQNSLGVEICINSDGDYNKAFTKAIELTRYLMQKYNIPPDRVVRHYDASRKICPASMYPNSWALWREFKKTIRTGPELELTAEQAIQKLADRGVINTPAYWLDKLKTVQYLDELLIKIVREWKI